MQNIVIDKPYVFVPPYRPTRWVAPVRALLLRQAAKRYGVTRLEVRHAERLRASVEAGHGIVVAPNHSRDSDPLVLGALSKAVGRHFYLMASWHLFMQGRLMAWVLRRGGAFSVYREGMDRQSVNAATEILETADRPLVLFPEGFVSRTNDRLNPLLEGLGVIARSAARKRAKQTPAGKVVVHPVAIRYRFEGDLQKTLGPTLEALEQRLTWRPRPDLPMHERAARIGRGFLALKEIEFLGEPQPGDTRERLGRLIDTLLSPLEAEWLAGEREPVMINRVKKIRSAILPGLVKGDLPKAEHERRWRQLADVYLAQSLSCYPPGYLAEDPTPERLLQTVEGFEEDLTDHVTPHPPIACTMTVGEAIEVTPGREGRGERGGGGGDPLIRRIEEQLRDMLGIRPDRGAPSPSAAGDTETADLPASHKSTLAANSTAGATG
jgi:1-acyl-sn-glycerol-3-phosphate acyltransferase